MKKTVLRSVLVALLVWFSLFPLGPNHSVLSLPVNASLLFAQTPTPQATSPNPSSPSQGTAPIPTPTNSPTPKATPDPSSTPAQAEIEQPASTTGPYDMEAIKAFNRALYGS